MYQTTPVSQKIVININCYDDESNSNYLGWVEGEKYKGIVVQASSIGECVKELGKSLEAIEIYRKNI